jgi:prepilin-type N-terminal cleavage/methylation domain-containing protein
MSRQPIRKPRRRRSDAGFTLPELLIAIAISGILVASISMAFTTVLQTQASATTRLAESKDITFVQTWLPVDLSSALETFDNSIESEIVAGLAAMTPSMHISNPTDPTKTGLPGTNVITIVRPDLELGSGVYFIVAYRYEFFDGEWQISRYEIRNPGLPSQTVAVVGVAHEVPAPPVGWDPTTPPSFAVTVSARNQMILRPIGVDVKIKFESTKEFQSGGAGLSAENNIDPSAPDPLENPTAPPSRCGGRMALVIDTSGSIGGFEPQIKSAANSFITSFSGTPYSLSLNGFATDAYGMTGTTNGKTPGTRAPFVSLLNGGTAVSNLISRVNGITVGGDTNWSSGLNIVFRKDNGTFAGAPYGTETPDLIVFITDGDPTRGRSTAASPNGGTAVSVAASSPYTSSDMAAKQAAQIANDGRAGGTELIGIMVGSATPSTSAVTRLQWVAAPGLIWNGSVNADGSVNLVNGAEADVFRGSFDQLGSVLRSILIAECGGTLTLQKRIDVGGGVLQTPTSGSFTFNAGQGDRTLDRSVTSSVTVDYPFASGQITKTVEVREVNPTRPFKGAQCTAGGVPVASPLLTDGTAGVSVTVSVDKAVSCLMISE